MLWTMIIILSSSTGALRSSSSLDVCFAGFADSRGEMLSSNYSRILDRQGHNILKGLIAFDGCHNISVTEASKPLAAGLADAIYGTTLLHLHARFSEALFGVPHACFCINCISLPVAQPIPWSAF